MGLEVQVADLVKKEYVQKNDKQDTKGHWQFAEAFKEDSEIIRHIYHRTHKILQILILQCIYDYDEKWVSGEWAIKR